MKTVTIYSFITLVALSMLIAVSPATAQDMRIGFVDPQVILQRMPEMRAVEQRFQNFVQRKQEEIGNKEQEFQTELEVGERVGRRSHARRPVVEAHRRPVIVDAGVELANGEPRILEQRAPLGGAVVAYVRRVAQQLDRVEGPVERAVITHAHSDHARFGHAHYLCSEPGRGVLLAPPGSIPLEE